MNISIKNSNPLFSILVASFNNGKYIRESFDSIKRQTYKNFEVIILEDCSADNSLDIINEYVKSDERFKVFFNEKNMGVGFTKNKIITLASGDICGLFDPDDILEPNALAIMVESHLKNQDASIISSRVRYCDENMIPIYETDHKHVEVNTNLFFNFESVITHFSTFKKDAYFKTSGINPYLKIAEDQDLYLKLYEVGNSIQLDVVLYNYRKNPSSIMNSNKLQVARYWHMVAAINAAQRRKVDISDLFFSKYVPKEEFIAINELVNSSRWIKLGRFLGFLK